mmetsp:Transcript_22260/g.10672  ORF Transcript_22260/g.10672 Transcript_22260/m.10672 type:complete len:235 (-) Transcript_22260:1873-2577(-)
MSDSRSFAAFTPGASNNFPITLDVLAIAIFFIILPKAFMAVSILEMLDSKALWGVIVKPALILIARCIEPLVSVPIDFAIEPLPSVPISVIPLIAAHPCELAIEVLPNIAVVPKLSIPEDEPALPVPLSILVVALELVAVAAHHNASSVQVSVLLLAAHPLATIGHLSNSATDFCNITWLLPIEYKGTFLPNNSFYFRHMGPKFRHSHLTSTELKELVQSRLDYIFSLVPLSHS